MIKDGPGPLTIVGDSTYSGGTLIKNGSLLGTTVDTMLGTGDVTKGGAGSNGATFTTGRSPANNFIITAPDSGTIIVGNLGAVETIVAPPATSSHVECTPEERARLGVSEGLIRYAAGIEDGTTRSCD